MTPLRLLRLLVPLTMLLASQAALYLSLRSIFRLGGRARAAVAAVQVACVALFLGFMRFAAGAGQLGAPRRWLVEVVLGAVALSVPVSVVLGLTVSAARRLRRAPASAGPVQPGRVAADDPPVLEPRRVFLARAATGLLGATGAAVAAGVWEAEQAPEVSRVDVPLAGLPPELDGLTVLQLSDIHSGVLMTESRMRRIADAAASLGADLVVYTGDLLDLSARSALPFARAFRDLHGRLGTFAILGNHDHYAGAPAALRALHAMDAVPLVNGGARIERGKGSLWLGGVEDPTGGPPRPQRALAGSAPEEPRILLAHRPSLFRACAEAGAGLVLSGHTHGGQLALSRSLTLARALGPYTMGLYRDHGAHLYVHRGMGTVAPAPLRLGSPPEIALLTLRRS